VPTFAADEVELLITPRPSLLPASGRAWVIVLIGAFLAGFLGQWGSVLLWVPPFQQATIWLPGSLLLAVTLLIEPRRWPLVVGLGGAGQTSLLLLLKVAAPVAALTLGSFTATVTLVTAWALRRGTGTIVTFATFREFVRYLAIAVVGAAALASFVYIGGATVLQYRPPTFLVWRTFALSAVLGYLMATPTALLLVRNAELIRNDTAARRMEGLLLVALLVIAAGIIFGGGGSRDLFWPVFGLVIPPLLLWAALRFGTLGAAGSVLLVTVISTFGTSRGLGPFGFESAADNTLSLQLFMLGAGFPLIGLAVILAEQRRTMSVLRETQNRLRGLNQDLLSAREAEGMRIAQELHDDVGQRLAMVSIGLSHLRAVANPEQLGPLGEIARLQEQTSSIAKSLRQISHDLHPTTLEHAGLATAIQMACEEVARVTGLDVQPTIEGDMDGLSKELALCLFRVAQEGLNNAVRHSGAKTLRVFLRKDERGIMLTVTDDGRGFSPAAPRERGGLGLHSAAQRVALAGGDFTIDSASGMGTTLRAQIPLSEYTRA